MDLAKMLADDRLFRQIQSDFKAARIGKAEAVRRLMSLGWTESQAAAWVALS